MKLRNEAKGIINWILAITILVISFPVIGNCIDTEYPEEQVKASTKQQPNNLEIYLLIGQSNMAGRAEIETLDMDTLKNVYLYTGIEKREWEKAANPFNKYSTIRKKISLQKLGPGYTFARDVAKFSTKKIGIVVNAKGGTSIDLWKPGSEFYREAVARTKAALNYGELKGIIWHQGESDASKHQLYLSKLLELIESLRADFALPDLPFVAGQLSGDKSGREGFNKMILELPAKIENTAVITTNNTNTIDSTHFNSASQRLLGQRYAKEMSKLIQQ